MKSINIMLVDDHAEIRTVMRENLEYDGDIQVIGEAANGFEALDRFRELHPEVVVMDISMPLMDGVEATSGIMKADPNAKVIIFSGNDDEDSVHAAFAAGAVGYVSKIGGAGIIGDAIRSVHQGNRHFSPAMLKRLEKRKTKVPA